MSKSYINFKPLLSSLAITIFVFFLLQFFTTPILAANGINRFINFQGKLVNNPAGTNVSNTTYTVVFTIYDKSTTGTTLWTETQTVTTTDGIFRVALGSVTPIPTNFNFNWSDLYLGMKVNADAEMTPRVQLAAVPFAFNSQQVAGLTVQDDSGNASTSGTLRVGNSKTVTFAGSNGLTFNDPGGSTTITLPGTGSITLVDTTTAQSLTNKTIGSTGLVFNGANTDITTVTNEDFVVSPNGSGKVGINAATPLASLDIRGNSGSGTLAIASVSGTSSFATLAVNNSGVGDLFTASKSGGSRFTIKGNGQLIANAYQTCNLETDATGLVVCGVDDTGGGGGNSPFSELSGAIIPNNSTEDFLIGGQSSTAAKFAFLNTALTRGSQVASISGSISLDSSTASIQSVKNQLLTLGGDKTGDISFKPGNSSSSLYLASTGNVGVGTATPNSKMQISASGDSSTTLNLLTLTHSAGSGSFTVDTSATLLTSLVDYWKFDENAGTSVADSVGSNIGTWNGTPGWTTGILNSSGNFTGSNYLITPNAASNTLSGTGNFSLSFWVYRNSNGTGVDLIGTRDLSAGFHGMVLTFNASASQLEAFVSSNGTSWNLVSSGFNAPITNATWTNVVLTRSGSTLSMYVNGVANGSTYNIGASSIYNAATGIYVGASGDGTRKFTGRVDEIGVWSKALTQQEITDLYNSGTADSLQTSGSAAGIGTGLVFEAGNSGIANIAAARISGLLTSVVPGTESGALTFETITNGGALTERARIDSRGNFGINTNSPLAALDVRPNTTNGGTLAVASVSGTTSFAALAISNNGSGDLFTASKSGGARFTIAGNGLITANAYQTCTLKTDSTGLVTCGTDNTGSGSSSPFSELSGVIVANNSTEDFLFGSQASVSARFKLTANTLGAGTLGVASVSGKTSFATLVTNNDGVGDLFTASSSSQSRFTIKGNGQLIANAYQTCTLKTDATGLFTCGTDNTGSGSPSPFSELSGAIVANNSTEDFLFGSQASVSARFRVSANTLGAGTLGVASVSGKTSFAALVANNDGVGDLFTASSSGWSRFVIQNNGNVGIGTSNPQHALELGASTGRPGGLGFGTDTLIWRTGPGALLFDGNGTAIPTRFDFQGGATSVQSNYSISGDSFSRIRQSADDSGFAGFQFGPGTTNQDVQIYRDGGSKLYLDDNGLLDISGLVFGINNNFASPDISSTFDIRGANGRGTLSVASISGRTSFAALVANNEGVGDIFSASKSGQARFTIAGNGSITANAYQTCTLKTDATGLFTCGTDNVGGGGGGYSPFQELSGAILPNNSTLDFLVGGQSSNSAGLRVTGASKFAGTLSVASISGKTSFATLVVDNSGVGDLFTASKAGATRFVISNQGNVGIGTSLPTAELEVVGDIISKGTKWTARASAADNNWSSVTYGNGIFVAVATTGTANRVMTSPDGINWTIRTSAFDNTWNSVTYGNTSGLFVAVSSDGTNRVMTSPDGITWTLRSAPANAWQEVTYGNGLFVAVSNTAGTGNEVMTSPDGINWTMRTSATSATWSSVAYGNGLFVAVSGTASPSTAVMTSADGINWASRTGQNNLWTTITYGNGLFVATGNGGGIETSSDGITWASRTLPSGSGSPAAVTYGNGLFIIVANSEAFSTSPDGVNWILRHSGVSNAWTSVTYGNGIFVAVSLTGSGNRVMTSGKTDSNASSNSNIYQSLTLLSSLSIGTTSGLATFDVRGNSGTQTAASVSAKSSFAALTVDNSGVGDLIAASSSGASRFVVRQNGSVTIGNKGYEGFKLDVMGSARIGNNTVNDDISKDNSSDFTVSGYSITQNTSVDTVTTTSNQLTLRTEINNGTFAAGPSIGQNVSNAFTIQRPDKKYVLLNTNGARIYDSNTNIFGGGPVFTTGSIGSGALGFQRADGNFVIILGGGTTTTQIYAPGANTNEQGSFTLGPVTSGNVGAGSQVIKRSDGKFLIIHGGGLTTTSVYDPTQNTFSAGPATTIAANTGSFQFRGPDGKWIVGLGGVSGNVNIYDPSLSAGGVGGGGTFTATGAPATGCTTGVGAHVIQLPDGGMVLLCGNSSATSRLYNSTSNSFSAGPNIDSSGVIGTGAHSFQRADGRWVVVLGGGVSTYDIYYPDANLFIQVGSMGGGAVGTGGHSFQRTDGKYITINGGAGSASSLSDAGWNTTGTWTSEDINSTNISTYSALLWSANPQSANNTSRLDAETITFSVKTGATQAALAQNAWITLQDSGNLIKAVAGAAWAKIKVDFTTPIRSYPQGATFNIAQTNIWPGEGGTFYRRSLIQPSVYSIKIQNPIVAYGDPGGNGDPAFGRSFATASATLEGVTTDNSNRLVLATNRNLPAATSSAGFIIASASASLGGSAGAGAHTIERSTGQFLVILGGGSTATRIYDPDTNLFSTGPTLPFAAGAGAHSFLMPDGRFFVVLGNTTNNTAIFDPQANLFIAGPKLFGNPGIGANSFQRPDGFFVIVNGNTTTNTNVLDPFSMAVTQGPFLTGIAAGGSMNVRRPDGRILVINGNALATTSLYDASTNAFIAGPALIAAGATTGTLGVQLSTGRVLIVRAGAATTTNLYDPISNSFVAGPTNNITPAAGTFAIPRSDGKVLIAQGGTTATEIYDPQSNTFSTTANSPTLPCTPVAGAHVFQRSTGEYVLICANSTANVAILDAGWNLGGSYTSEQLSETSLSSMTGMYWKNSGQGSITVKYRTSDSQIGLGMTPWKDLEKNGSLINPTTGDVWFQTRIDLQGDLQDQPGAKTRVWLGGDNGGLIVYYRQIMAPILQYWKLVNVADPTVLTLTSGGANIFRFTADGQAFTSGNGAWNSGGADLAERYTSTQSLEAGDVVVGDKSHAQNVIKSNDSYQPNIMGVVSTNPGFVAGSYTPNSFPIALVGRVPVKISTENGSIKSGDYLTSASIPGYAMKATVAGRVLGTALEDFDSLNALECPKERAGALETTQCGTITAFINLSSYNGQNVESLMADKGYVSTDSAMLEGLDESNAFSSMSNVSVKDRNVLSFLKSLQNSADSAILNSEIFTGRLSAVNIVSSNIIADLITAKTIRADRIEGLEVFTNQLSSLTNTISAMHIGTESGELASNSAQFVPGALNLQNLNVVGFATVSGQLNIKRDALINGMLTVLTSISAPNLIISEFASFFGDVIFKGNVTFDKAPTFSSDTAGFAVIKKGDNEVSINFDNEYANTPIVTASISLSKGTDENEQKQLEESILKGNIFYLITKRTSRGFVIKLNSKADSDITFSWVALSVNNSKTAKSDDIKSVLGTNSSATQSAAFQSILNKLNSKN